MVSFTSRPLYPRYPSDRRMGGPQSRSGRDGEETKTGACTCRESNPCHPVHRLLTTLTKQLRLHLMIYVRERERERERDFGLGSLAFSDSELNFWNLSVFGHLVGLFGRGISLLQVHYLHRTAQYKKTRTYIHGASGIRTHDPSVRAIEDCSCLRPRCHWDRHI
jgi:hypothetical protein